VLQALPDGLRFIGSAIEGVFRLDAYGFLDSGHGLPSNGDTVTTLHQTGTANPGEILALYDRVFP
jgi:hypothetical protein